eukprot:2204044-Pleurochrysis_carterae.AAC.1
MRAGAHARGAQRSRALCLRHSQRQTCRHGFGGRDGARVAPRRRRACAYAQTGGTAPSALVTLSVLALAVSPASLYE